MESRRSGRPGRRANAALLLALVSSLGCARAVRVQCAAGHAICPALSEIAAGASEDRSLEIAVADGLPEGHDGAGYHLQGVQQSADGALLVSGSARAASYLAVSPPDAPASVHELETRRSHAGGFQLDADLLAVGVEHPGQRDAGSAVSFLRLGPGGRLEPLEAWTLERERETAGAVGLLVEESGILVVVGSWDSEQLDFYHLDAAGRRGEAISWRHDAPGLAPASISRDWPAYQALQLFRLGSGEMILAGLFSGPRPLGRNHADFHRVVLRDAGAPEITRLARVSLPVRGARRFQNAGGIRVRPEPLRITLLACDRQSRDGRIGCSSW